MDNPFNKVISSHLKYDEDDCNFAIQLGFFLSKKCPQKDIISMQKQLSFSPKNTAE